MRREFVHLHTHSYFSLLAGLPAPEALVQRASELGQKAVALTDNNNMFGAIRFYRSARAAGIKPIFGLQLTVCGSGYVLTLLARTNVGYRNLLHLATMARTEQPYRRSGTGDRANFGGRAVAGSRAGVVEFEQLWEHGDGLIALSGGAGGELVAMVGAGRIDEARRLGAQWRERFGPDNFFIELQNQLLPGQPALNATLAQLARALGVGVVATNDVRYLHEGDAGAHAALLAMEARTTLAHPQRPNLGSAQYYFVSAEQMLERFADMPEALANTVDIAERCHVELDVGRLRIPAFRETGGDEGDGEVGGGAGAKADAAVRLLTERARRGAYERFGATLSDDVETRLNHELDIITGRGLAAYFLIVADIVDEARRRNIPVGPGRGSAASSLVAYCLHITAVDPLRYGLVFERFLNPERVRMPDIDIDVCDTRRDQLLAYVRERFGTDNVAQIVTFGTLAARAAVRETGKVLDIAGAKVDWVARMIPSEPGVTLAGAERTAPALARAVRDDAELRRLFSLAKAVEGVPRHLSVHAAGIVIGDERLEDDFPLIRTAEGQQVTQYAMDDVEALGFLKMDLLGLRTLAVIDDARGHIAAQGHSLPDTLPLDDGAVYEALRQRGAEGIFQLETPMFQSLVDRLQPSTFADIAALLALGRPGPMQRVDEFIRRRHGQAPFRYIHEALEPILKETYGVIVYQEQVMHIAMQLAGYSPAEADLLRRRLTDEGGRLPEAERERFLQGVVARGVGRAVAHKILDELMQFAGYGFAKSHSVAYALLTYETAWLRTYFPAAFLAALLTSHMGNPDRIRRYVGAARAWGTAVLGPDVNTSGVYFVPVAVSGTGGQAIGGAIGRTGREAVSFGLAGIRHVGSGAAAAVVEVRGETPFSSFVDFCERLLAAYNRPALIAALVEAGACDSLGSSRRDMLAAVGYKGGAGGAGSGRGHGSGYGSPYAPGQQSLFDQGGIDAQVTRGNERQRSGAERSDMIDVERSGLVLTLAVGHERYWPELRTLLAAHKGTVPVTLKVPTAEGVVAVAVDGALSVDGGHSLLAKLQRWIELGRLTGIRRLP